MSLPIVLIVGRPNVGKSTLFNRMTGRPAAVVFDRPGVTRDLLEAEIELGERNILMMDSAGWPYPGEDLELSEKINRTVEAALKKSRLILWVVEGPAGRTGAEDAFAERLQAYRKKTILIINKIDELDRPETAWADSEFAGLPWDAALPISSKHGRGIADLLSLLEDRLIRESKPADDDIPSDPSSPRPLVLSVLGRPNVGKSTLVNRLLKQDRVVVSDKPGTTRDAVATTFTFDDKSITLVDTAGVRRIDRITDGLERTTSKIALATGQNADVTLVLMDISQGLAEQDLRLISYLWRRGVTTIAAANKWDLVPDRDTEAASALKEEFRRRAHEAADVPFLLISAKTGHGVPKMMDSVFAARETAQRKVRTSELNRRMQEWNSGFPTGLFRGNPGKLKYAVQTGAAPIVFKIFVNDPDTFRNEALRYIEKKFRQTFNLHGVPIRIEMVQNQ